MTGSERWGLADDLLRALVDDVPGVTGRDLRDDYIAGSEDAHWVATGPVEDRSDWHFLAPPNRNSQPGYLVLQPSTLSTARRSLTLILTILHAERPRGWRWRLAARVIEISYPKIVDEAAAEDPAAIRLLPLFKWARWRILSEPFRQTSDSAPRAGHSTARERSNAADDPAVFARGAFGGMHSLRRKTRDSRTSWAEALIRHQDQPTLGSMNVEKEGQLLAFAGTSEDTVLHLELSDGSTSDIDEAFLSWFSRDFFSRRFMVREMWHTVRSPLKVIVAVFAVVGIAFALATVVWVPPETALTAPTTENRWVLLFLVFGLLASLATGTGVLVGGILWSRDGERFAYPFLLRFGAGTVLGSAAVIAMRASWLQSISKPGPGNEWRPVLLIAGLVGVGLMYLLVEARLNGPRPGDTLRRASVVWLIGLGWAVTIAALDILVIAPVFTEDYLAFSEPETRFWGFAIIALASLDLGIFLQVLWEDRPVTFPLGALRPSSDR